MRRPVSSRTPPPTIARERRPAGVLPSLDGGINGPAGVGRARGVLSPLTERLQSPRDQLIQLMGTLGITSVSADPADSGALIIGAPTTERRAYLEGLSIFEGGVYQGLRVSFEVRPASVPESSFGPD